MDPIGRGQIAPVAPTTPARPAIALGTRGAGIAAIVTGGSNLFHGDHARFSRTGSSCQLIGGLGMVSLKTPKSIHWCATTAFVGTLLNTTHAHVKHPKAQQAVKGSLIGGGLGFGIANHVGGLKTKIIATAAGLAVGSITGSLMAPAVKLN